MVLGLEGEGVDVHAIAGGVGMVLPRLDVVEVVPVLLGEPVLAVELDVALPDGVDGSVVPGSVVGGHVDAHEVLGEDGVEDVAGVELELLHGGGDEVVGEPLPGLVHELYVGEWVVLEVRGELDAVEHGGFVGLLGDHHDAVAELGDRLVDAAVGHRQRVVLVGGAVGLDGVGVDPVGGHLGDVEGEEVEDLGHAPLDLVEVGGVVSEELVVVGVVVLADLHGPHDLLAGVVEGEAELLVLLVDGVLVGSLELFDEVLVGVLGELLPLLAVEEDVVDEERGVEDRALDVHAVLLDDEPVHAGEVELEVDLVVLEGDEREGQTRVPAEPEGQGHVESGGLLVLGELGHHRRVADHHGVPVVEVGVPGELVPDVHPVAGLPVDGGATDLDGALADHSVPESLDPGELALARGGLARKRDPGLEVHARHQITVPGHGGSHGCLSEVGGAREGLLDGFDSEVGVSLVDYFKKSNLGIPSEINILNAISNQLHYTSSHCK